MKPQPILSDDDILDIRTALLSTAQLADAALAHTTDPTDRATLDKKRWDYLKLAERLAQ